MTKSRRLSDHRREPRCRLVAVLAALMVLIAACSSSGPTSSKEPQGSPGSPGSPRSTSKREALGEPTEKATFAARGGVGLVALTDGTPGSSVALLDRGNKEMSQGTVDRLGSHMFRDVPAGAGYTVREAVGGKVAGSSKIKVLALADNPPDSFYADQAQLVDGYQYLTTRDGTTLAVMVRPPAGKTLADGPFPTLINMSGYADADPDSPPPMTQISQFMGYATVSVNERGTGCSGGVNGLFDRTWTADGYDVVEAVAAQKWSAKVGLTGISFPGITQIFTAGAQPPHLAAITPMSVMADVYRSPAYPGGIFNDGFTKSWLTDRRHDARPAPEDGQGYARAKVKAGDKECLDNQKLRLQTIDPIALTSETPFRDPKLMDERSPISWVAKIKVPTLLMGAWQDEQVGADFANLFPLLPSRPNVKVVAGNGVHSSPIEPDYLTQWLAFVDIYVADRVPDLGRLKAIDSAIAVERQGGDATVPEFPADPYVADKTVAEAKTRYEALPRIRILFDSGANPSKPGLPGGGFEEGFDTWPPKQTEVTRWYFGADGKLGPDKPTDDAGSDRYFPTISARPMQTIPGQGQSESWVLLPDYDWRPLVARTAVAYATEPLTRDTAMVGTGSVDLAVRSSTPDTDLQVTLTEVRPDGKELYVQNGWLRASHRHLDPKRSTEVNPWPTHLKGDAEPLPINEFETVRVAIQPVAHVFRKGSRLRISVEAPGGDRTRWSFESAAPAAGALVDIGRSAAHPSSIALPMLTTLVAPDAAPPCPSLRGEPCREYVPASNGG